MAIKPEFIGLLRDIRDRIYTSVNMSEQTVLAAKDIVVNLTEDLQTIDVVTPITVVPVQENGEPGLPNVTYDTTTNKFTFSIPAGSDGEDLAIKYTVALTADLYTINTVQSGEVAFSNEDSKIYVKLDTGTNVNASDWSTGTTITPTTLFKDLTDTPVAYTGNGHKAVVVKDDETGLTYLALVDLTTNQTIGGVKTFTAQLVASGGITGDLSGVASSATTLVNLTSTTDELNILDGVTTTTEELNILDGVTTTTEEINILDGVTATTAEINQLDGLTLASGIYTPTITGNVNFTSSITSYMKYTRVGNIVTVSFSVPVTATSASSSASFYMTIPIASSLASWSDLIGSGAIQTSALSIDGNGEVVVQADTTGNRASVGFDVGIDTTVTVYGTFQYEVK